MLLTDTAVEGEKRSAYEIEDTNDACAKKNKTCTACTDFKLWKISQAFCEKWPQYEGTTDNAIGVRSILALFYMLAKTSAGAYTSTTRPDYMDIFPVDESWFEYVGRFLALYIRETNDAGDSVRITNSARAVMNTIGNGNADDVKVVALEEAQGPVGWAKVINADCNTATHKKIPVIVKPDDLSNEKFQCVALAAEFIKGDFSQEFDITASYEAPFYGIEGGETGRCHLMSQKYTGSGQIVWQGETCQAAIMSTYITGTRTKTNLKLVAVLPHEDDVTFKTKRTSKKAMDAAFEEIKHSGEKLHTLVKENDASPKYENYKIVQMPRIERKMDPYDLTETCEELLPSKLMTDISDTTEVWDAVDRVWKESPMFVSKVLHATYIKVDEKGFEAAAATAAICFVSMSADEAQDPVLRIDRAYLFYIMDMGPSPHVLYHARIETDKGLRDAPQAMVN